MQDRGRPSRRQAQRPTSPLAIGGIALAVLAAIGIGFGGTLLLTTSSATPSPSRPVSAVSPSASPPHSIASEVPTASAVASETATQPATPSPSLSPVPTPSPSPTPARTATPAPTPTRTPVATVPSGPRSTYVTSAPQAGRRIALTFDFGGRVGDAKLIVDYLTAQGVHATVFSTGNQANAAATDTTVAGTFQVVCSNPHIALGNHSMTHADFAKLTPAQMVTELTGAQAALAKVCPSKSPKPFFRPPSGSLGGWQTAKFYQILDTVGGAGYSRTVGWSIDTLDWGAPGTTYYRTTQQIVENVESHATNGSIVLMHLGGYNTYPAIQQILPYLEAHGFELVTLNELLGV